MQVKIFQAFGKEQIDLLERKINDWLGDGDTIKVAHTNTAAASVSDAGGSSEMYQTVIVTVWYSDRSK